MIRPRIPLLLTVLGTLCACPDGSVNPPQCTPLTAAGVDARLDLKAFLLVAGDSPREVVLSAAPSAAPPGTRLTVGETTAAVGAHGAVLRASVENPSETTITVRFDDGDTSELLARALTPQALAQCAATTPTATGALPNDIVQATCDGSDATMVVASADATLSDVGGERSIFFAPDDDGGANPYAAATTPDGHAAVTLYGTDEIAWVDGCTGDILQRDVARQSDGSRAHLPLDAPLTLRIPRDIDGDGVDDDTLTSMPLLAPQGVAVAGEDVFVSFTNLLEPADNDSPQTIGPGVVGRFSIGEDALTLTAWVALPRQNPQALIVDAGRVVVAASGALGAFSTGYAPVTPSGLCHLPTDFDANTVVFCDGPADAVVAEPARVGDFWIAGDLLRAAIHVFSASDGTYLRTISLTDDNGLDAVFAVMPLGHATFGALHFNADTLVIFSLEALTSTDSQVTQPVLRLPLRPEGTTLIRGPVASSVSGDTIHVLLSVSAEVLTVDRDALWGLR